MAYRLTFPSGSQVHNVFHVSFLQKHLGLVTLASKQLLPITDDSIVLPQSKAILDHCIIRKGKYHPKFEILVKWEGALVEDANWENEWRFAK